MPIWFQYYLKVVKKGLKGGQKEAEKGPKWSRKVAERRPKGRLAERWPKGGQKEVKIRLKGVFS